MTGHFYIVGEKLPTIMCLLHRKHFGQVDEKKVEYKWYR